MPQIRQGASRTMDEPSVGQEIERVRTKLGLKLNVVALAADREMALLYQIEQNAVEVDLATLNRLIDAFEKLGASSDDLRQLAKHRLKLTRTLRPQVRPAVAGKSLIHYAIVIGLVAMWWFMTDEKGGTVGRSFGESKIFALIAVTVVWGKGLDFLMPQLLPQLSRGVVPAAVNS